MGSIPLPALDIKTPQEPDTLQKYGQLMALKNAQLQQQEAPLRLQALQQQVQTGGLQVQQQQRALKDQQGIADWYKNLDPTDPNALDPISVGKSLQKNGVSGEGILNVQGKILQQRQTAATLTKDQLANQQTISDNLYSGINGVIGETDPNKRAQAITPLLTTAAQNKLIDPQTAQQLLANPGAVTDDQLKQFQKGLGVSAAFLTAAARQQAAKTEADKFTATKDPNSSLYAPTTASVALGTAPGAAGIQAGEAKLAGDKAAAEARARQPYELALAAQRQALSQGDPRAAAHLLVTGDATLGELKSRGATPEFIAKTLFYAHQESNGSYNAQAAEAQFDVAKSPANVAFFGSAKSLTDKGGTLDQLAEAAKAIPGNQIPVFNTVADAAKAATGNGPIAKYASLLLGVSDDYSKVMGGGQGSDASRNQALHLVPANASPEARAAAIEGIRGAVGSQLSSRIGDNPVLKRMYGGNGAPSGGGISVGSVITQNGHQYKVTAVDKNGKPTSADPVQ